MDRNSVTRRDFLRKSAIAAGIVAFPYFYPGLGQVVSQLVLQREVVLLAITARNKIFLE